MAGSVSARTSCVVAGFGAGSKLTRAGELDVKVLDERAFLEALRSGKVSAAGLDVIHGEWMEDIGRHPLVRYARAHDTVLITPHIASATVESVRDAQLFMGNRFAAFLRTLDAGNGEKAGNAEGNTAGSPSRAG